MINGLSIRERLYLQTAIALLSMVLIGGLGLSQVRAFHQVMQAEQEGNGARTGLMLAAERAQISFKTQVQEWKNVLLRGQNKDDFNKYLGQFGKEEKRVQEFLAQALDSHRALGRPTGDLENIVKQHQDLGAQYREALQLYDAESANPAQLVDKTVRGKDRPIAQGLDALVEQVERDSLQQAQSNALMVEQSYIGAHNILIVGIALAALLVVWLSITTGGRITRVIAEFNAVMHDISGSWDLRLRAPATGRHEIAETAGIFNSLMENLQHIVRQVRLGVADLTEANATLSSVSTSHASLAQTHSDATSAIAAAIEESSLSIAAVKDSAADANAASHESSRLADQGVATIENAVAQMQSTAHVVQETTKTVEQLVTDSQQISGIVQVIQEVADQTNLLALNAAIEAARAGEQGRGFAVVADEVRQLAKRTTHATGEIAAVIGRIQLSAQASVGDIQRMVEQVKQDAAQIDAVGATISGIRDSAERVHLATSDISLALTEQSKAVEDIAQRISAIVAATESDSGTVGEVERQIFNLQQLGNSLIEATNRFQA